MIQRPILILFMLLALSAFAGVAMAQDVFLNGVKVNGLKLQSFDAAEVEFDKDGNVHIKVADVRVEFEEDARDAVKSKKSVARLQKAYWLVASKTNPGTTQFDIDVHINGRLVVTVASSERKQVAMKINKFLVPGSNTVVFTARKEIGEARKSFSAQDELTLYLGVGSESAQQITIDQTLASYTRSAADLDNHLSKITINAE